jgi:DNA-binding beta-propeller fold protein YncE
VGTRIPVGANPKAIAVNPVTNKVYVANANVDTVTIINANTGGTTSVPVGDFPAWIGINTETNRIYVSSVNGANTTILDGDTDTAITTAFNGGAGPVAVNPFKDTTYVVRSGGAGEVSVIEGTAYKVTFTTRSTGPLGIAVNPLNNRVFVAHGTTGDVTANDLTTADALPPLVCPDGSGGIRPQPAPPPALTSPCIDVAGSPVAVAVNPVTNRIYAISNNATGQISVINGTNHTFTSLTPAGVGVARTIAVNPVTNTAYAVFSNAVVVVDGSNTMTVIPHGSGGGGPVAIGINVLTNMVYVPSADGTLLTINAQTGATNSVAITVGANAVAVNPVANMIYVLDAGGGVTPVTGAVGTATSTGITTTINPLPGNTGAQSGTITVNASSSMTPAPLNNVRRVYYRLDGSGPWTAVEGTGPYPVGYAGLAPGSHTLQTFATNGLEAPNINTDLANVPVVGNIASYAFTVSASIASNPARLANIAARMRVLTGDNVLIGGFAIGGSTNKTVVVRARGPSMAADGVPGTLADPQLQLFSGQTQIGYNNNWQEAANAAQITSSGFAPPNPFESAILINLAPGLYSAIVTGVGSTTGVGLIEVFEVGNPTTPFVNLATRGQVLTGSDVMIGGFIIQGDGPQTVVVRARGPSLASSGLTGLLANPLLQLFSGQTQIAVNDSWQDAANAGSILASGYAPAHPAEAAILITLQPGAYTAIVTGVGNTTGVAIVEMFNAN